MAKILCVLYKDPIDGYPGSYARDELPELKDYPGGQLLPVPKKIDFKPGELLGSVSGELGLRKFLENAGHTFIVTADKDGPDSRFAKELVDAEVVISQPFWPAYLSAEQLAKAKNLKLVITAGIGSDHVDLKAAIAKKITVAEVTYSNSNSVAEQNILVILALVRNFIPSHNWVIKGGWNVADCVARAYDLEGMNVGIVGAGRIGLATLKRLKPFDVKLHYTDKYRLSTQIETDLHLTFHQNVQALVPLCDIVVLCCPLHAETESLFNKQLISTMKRGAYLINTARGKICVREAVVEALENRHLAGYGGDVWDVQPAPPNHLFRTMPHHAMTPHVSGSTLSAQARYAAGTREILEAYFAGLPIREEYLIVDQGELAGSGAHSYSVNKEEELSESF